MNVSLLLYILLCIAIGFSLTMYLVRAGRAISAGVFGVGAILIFIFFGLRWFVYDKPKWASKDWPPTINTCPDFLTYLNLDGKDVCIDTLGVSTNPGGAGGKAGLKRWTYGTTPPPGVGPEFYFDLSTNKTNAIERMTEYCNRCLEKGVTWEGICDGESCYKFARAAAAGGAGGGEDSKCASATNQPVAPPSGSNSG